MILFFNLYPPLPNLFLPEVSSFHFRFGCIIECLQKLLDLEPPLYFKDPVRVNLFYRSGPFFTITRSKADSLPDIFFVLWSWRSIGYVFTLDWEFFLHFILIVWFLLLFLVFWYCTRLNLFVWVWKASWIMLFLPHGDLLVSNFLRFTNYPLTL